MKNKSVRWLLYAAWVVVYLLHNDLWNWHDPSLMLGLPVGLLYHIGFCFMAAGLLFLLTRYAWPDYLDHEAQEGKS